MTSTPAFRNSPNGMEAVRMESKRALMRPSEADIDAADAWIDEHFGVSSTPSRLTVPHGAPQGFAFALAAAMARRRDRSGVGHTVERTVH